MGQTHKGQGHRVKNNGTQGKVLSQGIFMWKSNSSTHCSKVISMVKFSERRTEWQNYKMTDRTKTICPPIFNLRGIKNVILLDTICLKIIWIRKIRLHNFIDWVWGHFVFCWTWKLNSNPRLLKGNSLVRAVIIPDH